MNFPAGAVTRRNRQALPLAESHPLAAASLQALSLAGCQPLADFCRLTDSLSSWQRLERESVLPMQGYAFVQAVADHLSNGMPIRIFHVVEGNRVTALLPLASRPGVLGRLKVVGEDALGEPSEVLCTDREAATRLAEAIVDQARTVDLDRLPADSPLVEALATAARGKARITVRPARPTPALALDPSWSDPAAQFNSGRRSDFRRAARRAAEFGTIKYEVLAPTCESFDSLFDEAIQVEAKSWKKDVGTAIAVDSCKERFFRHYFRAACERGEFRLAFLRIDNKVVAMQMALVSLDRYWLFKIGFDEDFARCSPGTLLMLHTIGWAAERRLRTYEFLGNVEPWIAQLWTRQQHEYVRLRLYPYNLRGAAALASDCFIWLCKKVVRAARR